MAHVFWAFVHECLCLESTCPFTASCLENFIMRWAGGWHLVPSFSGGLEFVATAFAKKYLEVKSSIFFVYLFWRGANMGREDLSGKILPRKAKWQSAFFFANIVLNKLLKPVIPGCANFEKV